MIKKVSGDILLTKAQVIAHGVAPHDHFNQGLALALREKFPVMAKDFRHYCHQSNPNSGDAWLWAGPGAVVVNLLTQGAPANDHAHPHPEKATLQHVDHSLKALRKLVDSEGLKSIALPKLATGVGGLAWGDVESLIQKHFSDVSIPVIVYENYQKDVAASEGL